MKPYKDTEYFVTEDGRLFRNGRQLKTNISKGGYKKLVISNNSLLESVTIHRLVAETFIPNPENKCCVNHKDGNKLNNHHTNLEWVSNSENQLHRFHILGKGSKENAYQSKLTNEDIQYIRQNYIPRHKEFGQNALARKFDMNQKSIWCIIHHKTWI
jgi:HNH endonuclease